MAKCEVNERGPQFKNQIGISESTDTTGFDGHSYRTYCYVTSASSSILLELLTILTVSPVIQHLIEPFDDNARDGEQYSDSRKPNV